ncbi:MAG: hypothetical protein E7466_06200 [Ruminococcaceae bacterium]|nr:hypothetical protein [Oscillospiraceae bacterium]
MNKIRILSLALAVCLLAGCRSNSSEPEVSTSQKPIANAPTTSQTQATTPSQTEGEVVPAPETTAPSVDEPVETPPTINWSDWIDVVTKIPVDEPVVVPPEEIDPLDVTVEPRLYWEDSIPKLAVKWTNNSSHTITICDCHNVQQLVDDQWIYSEYEGKRFNYTADGDDILPGQSLEWHYGANFYVGASGQYRFVSDYGVDVGTGPYVSQEVTAEFTLDWNYCDLPTFEPVFTSRYLSTPALIDEVQYPEPIALYTTDQFWEYSLANESAFDLREYHTLWSEYSDNFFDDHYLIVIPLEGGADTIDNEVHLLQANYLGNHHVFIRRQNLDEGSGSWHIILEVEKPKSSSFPRGPYVQTTLYEIGE